jgi:NAD/NADP transhydrogenase beta subunit
MPPTTSPVLRCLIGVILGIVLVGFIGGTPARHAIQALPACIALIAVGRNTSWSSAASLAVFLFWLVVMALIWLHLFGFVHIITGDFSKIEIVLTVFIGAWSLFGAVLSFGEASAAKRTTSVTAFLSLAALQLAAFFVSLRPFFAHR